MKTQILKLALFCWVTSFLISAHAQELASIPSNFDTSVWARTTEHLPSINFPRPWGEFPNPCSYSHLRYDDPIAKQGQFGKSPLHIFFGNRLTNANTTYSSLRKDGDGTCIGGPLNRSAFYMPAMMVGGKVILPDLIDTYYRGTPDTKPFPRGLKMIFGVQQQTSAYTWDVNSPRYGWSFGGVGQWWTKSNNGWIYKNLLPNVLPDYAFQNPTYNLSIRAVSPDCWDGKNLDSADHHSHLAYSGPDASINTACPADHPVKIPQVTVTVYYDWATVSPKGATETDAQYNARLASTRRTDLQGWSLSSDTFGGKNDAPGTNWYVGFIPAWDDSIMATWVSQILNTNFFGALSRIGDGRLLDEPPTSKIFYKTVNENPPYFLWSLRAKFTTPYVTGDEMRVAPPTP